MQRNVIKTFLLLMAFILSIGAEAQTTVTVNKDNGSWTDNYDVWYNYWTSNASSGLENAILYSDGVRNLAWAGSNVVLVPTATSDIDKEDDTNFIYVLGRSDGVMGLYNYTGTSLAANKIYLIYDGRPSDIYSDGTRTLRVVLGGENNGNGETTGIKTAEFKWEENVIYDLQGRRIEKPTHSGLYIVNGKKVYIKK